MHILLKYKDIKQNMDKKTVITWFDSMFEPVRYYNHKVFKFRAFTENS